LKKWNVSVAVVAAATYPPLARFDSVAARKTVIASG
jgi:hypothetical protein